MIMSLKSEVNSLLSGCVGSVCLDVHNAVSSASMAAANALPAAEYQSIGCKLRAAAALRKKTVQYK
jgi:hypothetical protein